MRVVRDPKTGPTKCRRCGERIVWALTDNNKRMPVDAQASLDVVGTRFVLWWTTDGTQRVSSRGFFEVMRGELYGGQTWGAHWGTCAAVLERRKLEGKPIREERQLSLLIGGKR